MKLRFDVDQAACVRAGIDHGAPTAVIDVDAAKIKIDVRNLIADRLIGNDVCQLWNSDKGTIKSVDAGGNPVRLIADAPTFEALVKAVLKDAQIVQARNTCHRAIALAHANSAVELPPIAPSNGLAPIAPGAIFPTTAPIRIVKPVAAATAPDKKRRRGKRIPTKSPKTTRRKKAA